MTDVVHLLIRGVSPSDPTLGFRQLILSKRKHLALSRTVLISGCRV